MKQVLKSEFAKNVLKHFTGTAGSNLITIAVLPILTRLYSASDFGMFQLLVSTVVLFSTISTLKLELAVVLPKYEVISNAVFKLAIVVLIATTAVFSLFLILFGNFILSALNAETLAPYIFYISLGIFTNGFMQLVQYLPIRAKDYSFLAKSKIIQSGFSQSAALGAGILGANFLGLFLSMVAGFILNVILILNKNRTSLRSFSNKRLLTVFKRYKKFPIVNTPMTFFNTLSKELPVFMFTIYFGAEVVGLYMAAKGLINRPINMIGKSISQVYLQTASDAYHRGGGELIKLYKKTVLRMALIVSIPLIIIIIAAPDIVAFILGDAWRESGYYMQILSFWIFFQFITSPVGTTFSIINKQEIGLVLIAISLAIRFIAMTIFSQNVTSMMTALSVSAGLFYLVYLLVMYFLLKREE